MIFDVEAFEAYRKQYPQLRYFQALCSFLGMQRIEVVFADDGEFTREDTFYWEDKHRVKSVDNSASV